MTYSIVFNDIRNQDIENFLPEDVHKEYFEHYHSLTPVWRFVQKANSNADDTGNTYFMNETYHDTWKDKDGSPSKLAKALKKWGFGSVEAARNFCNKNKNKKK